MRFNDDEYNSIVKIIQGSRILLHAEKALLAAHERVLTLEAEIKLLVDVAVKGRAEIERLTKAGEDLCNYGGSLGVELHDVKKECDRLREDLKLSEARRAELVIVLEKYSKSGHCYPDGGALREGAADIFGECARKALASQPRPKILAVYEASKELMALKKIRDSKEFKWKLHTGLDYRTRKPIAWDALDKALAAMKEE